MAMDNEGGDHGGDHWMREPMEMAYHFFPHFSLITRCHMTNFEHWDNPNFKNVVICSYNCSLVANEREVQW